MDEAAAKGRYGGRDAAAPDDLPRWKILQQVAARGVERQVGRYRWLEEKVWRHAALLGIVLSAFAVGLPEAVKMIGARDGAWVAIFAIAYLGAMLTSFSGLWCFYQALRFKTIRTNPVKEGFVQHFDCLSSVESLRELTDAAESAYVENMKAFEGNEDQTGKEDWAERGWWWLGASLLFLAVAVVSFSILQFQGA